LQDIQTAQSAGMEEKLDVARIKVLMWHHFLQTDNKSQAKQKEAKVRGRFLTTTIKTAGSSVISLTIQRSRAVRRCNFLRIQKHLFGYMTS